MVYQWIIKSKMDKVARVDTQVMNRRVCADRRGRERKRERERWNERVKERERKREREKD